MVSTVKVLPIIFINKIEINLEIKSIGQVHKALFSTTELMPSGLLQWVC